MDKNKNRIQNLYGWKYYLIVALVFLVGIIVMLYSDSYKTENNWIRLTGEIGAFIAAAIVSHFIYDRFLRKDEELLLLETLRQIQFEKESGIISAHEMFPLLDFENDVKSSKQNLWILQTWIGNFISIETALKIALEKKISVKILVLHPHSIHAKARGKELGIIDDLNYASNEIISNLIKLDQLSKEAKHPSYFEVKVYDGSGTFSLHIVDEIIYLGFFGRERNNVVSPHLKLKLGNDYYFSNYAMSHFNSIWKSSTIIDFSDDKWKFKLQ